MSPTFDAPIESAVRSQLANGALAGIWIMKPELSRVEFRTRAVCGLIPVKGTFKDVRGHGTVSSQGAIAGSITIAAASIDTGINRRDVHLRSADFLDTGTYPDIIFTAERMASTEEGMALAGTLRVRDHAESMTLPITVNAPAKDQLQLRASICIDRRVFGIDWNRMRMTSAKCVVTVDAAFHRSKQG